jgi:hypothetical protein
MLSGATLMAANIFHATELTEDLEVHYYLKNKYLFWKRVKRVKKDTFLLLLRVCNG